MEHPGFAESLGRATRHAWRTRPTSLRLAVAGAAVTLLRLEGTRVRYLATVTRRSGRSVEVSLSPRQQEVAEFAAAGATIPEIARTLRRSEETVRSHLREVYRRLEICSRLELFQAIGS